MADQVLVSASNRTPVVQIVTWFCLAVSVLAFFSHAGIKIYLVRSITIETGFAFLALVRDVPVARGLDASSLCGRSLARRSQCLLSSRLRMALGSRRVRWKADSWRRF